MLSGRCHSFYGPLPKSCWATSSWCSAWVRSRRTPTTSSTLAFHCFARWYVKSMKITESTPYILVVPMIGKIRDNAGRRTVLKALEVDTRRLSYLVMPLAIRISYELLTSLHHPLLLVCWCCQSWCRHRTRVVWWSKTHSHRFTMNPYINAHNHWDS